MFAFKRGVIVAMVLLAAVLLTGCPPKGPTPAVVPDEEGEAPHGGTLFAPLGNDHPVHAELVIKDVPKPTIYLLDKNVKNAVSTPADKVTLSIEGSPRKTVVFKPDREAGDPEGESSRFTTDDAIPENVDWKKAEITLTYKGKPWTLHLDDH